MARNLRVVAVLVFATIAVLATISAVTLLARPTASSGSPVGTKVDGFAIGREVDCSGANRQYFSCQERIDLGRAALDQRLSDHAAVVRTGLYDWDVTHSETIDIVVFDLADGSRWGERVLCGVGGCTHF